MSIAFTDLKAQYAAQKAEIDARIATVLAHGQYIMGPEVKELETALARRTGTAHCITVASGTEALLIALMALGIGPGDEVITSAFTFAASGEAIVLVGATPVFVDIDATSYNVDPAGVEAAITPLTRAIMPVSLYGLAADMDAINAIAARHGNIPVIEDAAQSLGARYRGRESGALSTIGCTSFFPSKPLGCYGDGGAIFTDDDAIALAAREIRVHGQSQRYLHTRIGVGGRMDTLQCAIVLGKLPRFEWEIARRAAIGARYVEWLADLEGDPVAGRVRLPRHDGGVGTCVYAQFTVEVARRDAVRAALDAQGVPTAVHYPLPLNEQPAYKHVGRGPKTPVARRAAQHVLSLPMSADLNEDDQRRVVDALMAAVRDNA